MAIPPQIICVKRKRDEDPPDALYFERASKSRDNVKRPFTEYAFKLLREKEPTQQRIEGADDTLMNHDDDGITEASEHQNDVVEKSPLLDTAISPQQASETVPTQTESGIAVLEKSHRNIHPRRFHLSKLARSTDTEKVLRRHQQHHKILQHSRLKAPIFAERHAHASPSKQRLLQSGVIQARAARKKSMVYDNGELDRDESRRKIPGTRKGRELGRPPRHNDTVVQDAPDLDPSIVQIFAEMQKEYEDGLHDHSAHGDAYPVRKTRFKPKIPAKRSHERHPEVTQPRATDELMEIDGPNDTDYVYDTYIRLRADPSSSQIGDASLGSGTFGILVIDEDEQSLWEEFVDDEDSDKDWNSEDEDENAEDYYGADYPEEEVDVDDEYDIGAYNYRCNASDDEQYDSETGAWSDEDQLRYPWKTNPRLKPATDDEDSDE